MRKFVCSVCGYVHTADELAADFKCPVCKVPTSKFAEQALLEFKFMTGELLTLENGLRP